MSVQRLMHRPIYGGIFGEGRYALATMPCVLHGLHAIRYMVMDPQGGAVLSVADDKVAALAGARRVLRAANDARGGAPMPATEQLELWTDEPLLVPPPEPPQRHVSRRRREIFERAQGKCFYCGSVLQLDGKWHVEHQQPRALGGEDHPLNLVAACARCNLRKGDRTAIEFLAAG